MQECFRPNSVFHAIGIPWCGMTHDSRTLEMSTYKFVAVAKGLTILFFCTKDLNSMWEKIKCESNCASNAPWSLHCFFFLILYFHSGEDLITVYRIFIQITCISLSHSHPLAANAFCYAYLCTDRTKNPHTEKRVQQFSIEYPPLPLHTTANRQIHKTWPLIALISHEIRTIIAFIATEKRRVAKINRVTASTVLGARCVCGMGNGEHKKTRRNYIFIANKQQWHGKGKKRKQICIFYLSASVVSTRGEIERAWKRKRKLESATKHTAAHGTVNLAIEKEE